MGQANSRGTYEERKKLALDISKEVLALRIKQHKEELAALSPNERKKREDARAMVKEVLSACSLVGTDPLKGLL